MKIRIHIEKGKNGWYVVTVPSLPGCVSQGKSMTEAKKNIKEAIKLHLKCLLEDGIPISPPRGVRQEVIVIDV